MNDAKTPPKTPDTPKSDARPRDLRAERLAQQLRENLRRRKAQAKGQKDDSDA